MTTKTKSSAKTKPTATRSRSGKTTTDHDRIRKWAEQRSGHPATVIGTGHGHAGLLRIDFPGYRGEKTLREISWGEFFQKFDEKNLAFLYQDKTATGKPSRFCKLISRETEKSRSKR